MIETAPSEVLESLEPIISSQVGSTNINTVRLGDDKSKIQECDDKAKVRNREHAKKTRLRKKVLIESMISRLLELQCEVRLYDY